MSGDSFSSLCGQASNPSVACSFQGPVLRPGLFFGLYGSWCSLKKYGLKKSSYQCIACRHAVSPPDLRTRFGAYRSSSKSLSGLNCFGTAAKPRPDTNLASNYTTTDSLH
jgi:hypothetical protein